MPMKHGQNALLLFLAFILFLPVTVFPQAVSDNGKINAAVIDLDVKGMDVKDAGSIIAGWMADALNRTGRFALKERSAIAKLMEEQKLAMTGVIDESTAAEVGKALGVQYLVLGAVSKLGSTISVAVRLVDVKTFAIIRTATITTKDLDELSGKMDTLAG